MARPSPFPTILVAPFMAFVIVIIALSGCGPSEEKVEIQRSDVEADLGEFLPLLAASYSDGNVERLRPYTAEKELARITLRVQELAAEGKVLAPEFQSVTVESVNAWSANQAFATTVEVWQIRLYTIGAERRLITEVPPESSRVKYQIRFDGERWRVMARQIEEA